MAKKKKKPRKPKPQKPLLALTGILHLQKSFVQPSQESGLLNTVGGEGLLQQSSLVLAPNYGYGISAATVSQLQQNRSEQKAPPNIVHVDGVPTITQDKNVMELHEDFPTEDPKDIKAQKPAEDLTIAELVRSIGGAKDRPFMMSDVVQDPSLPTATTTEEQVPEENHPAEDAFYESLGISRPKTDNNDVVNAKANDAIAKDPQQVHRQPQVDQDNTASVADYYKTYCKYYYSVPSDPFGDKPIEFGQLISNETSEDTSKQSTGGEQDIIHLARMAQSARRAMEAAKLAAQKVYGPNFPTEEHEESYDPLPMEIIPSQTPVTVTRDTTMEQYWEYVKENPRDFNRWTYLAQHAENTKNIRECRKAYSAFLPLFPYCFGYWKRYCEIEKSHMYYQRCLSILLKALEFNPTCIDLWQTYLKLFREVYSHHDNFENNFREQYEKALGSAGMDFRSDALWEDYIDWEVDCNKKLRKGFKIYRRVLTVPTRLYNRHFDNLKALVRDHHPRDFLDKDEYELLRKKGCKVLGFRYKEEPEVEPGEIIKPTKPEDKLMTYAKEKILNKLEKSFKSNEREIDKRWTFEDRIRRPYFHIKPLDRAQLRNWEDYLNFEISQGDHDRIVLLFERCLIACAPYERFWTKYARYLEKYHRTGTNSDKISPHFQKSQISFEVGSRKEIEEEEALVATVTDVLNNLIDCVVIEEEKVEARQVSEVMASILSVVCGDDSSSVSVPSSVALSGNSYESPPNSLELNFLEPPPQSFKSPQQPQRLNPPQPQSSNSKEQISRRNVSSLTSQLSIPSFPTPKKSWHQIIRDVYKRACMVHCPRKPIVRLQWAAFEEEIGNVTGARQLIQHVLEWHPTLLEAQSQLIELERRAGNVVQVVRLFEEYLNKSSTSSQHFSTFSIKYARFLHKEQGKTDRALAVLRKAVKKDKGNHLLYSYVFEICLERFPTDRKGAAAALELAIQNKEIKNEYKLQFMTKKVLFLQEHGELVKYRDALDQLYELKDLLLKEKAGAEAEKLAAEKSAQVQRTFPVPVWEQQQQQMPKESGVPIPFEPVGEEGAGPSQSDPAYKSVPPTNELLDISPDYGYSNKHPDCRLQEKLSHQEYDRLLCKGYPDVDKVAEESYRKSRKRKHDIPMYIVPPKGPFLSEYIKKVRRRRE